MRQGIGVFLLVCFLMPFWATYSLLHHQKYRLKKHIKRQIIKGISKDKLVLLKFSKKEAQTKLHWEHAKEFEFAGEMYDVVDMHATVDSVQYWCWWDSEEALLNQQLYQLLGQQFHKNPHTKATQLYFFVFFKSLFPFNLQEHVFEEGFVYITQDTYFFNVAIHSIFLSFPSPPPECMA